MKKKETILAIILGVALLVWNIDQGFGGAKKEKRRKGRNIPVAVVVEPIRKTSINEIGNYTGTLIPNSEFFLAPKIGGRLVKIMVNIGDLVRAGQFAAILDDEENQQLVLQAQAELMVARATLQERKNSFKNSKREFERTQLLRKKKIASESQLDTARSELNTQIAKLKVAEAQVVQKNAALKMAKIRLSYTRISIPENVQDGYHVVGERFVDEGSMLLANTPIVSILDIGELIAVIHVIERDYPKIRKGLDATISTDAYPGLVFTGRIIRIAPLIKEKSREARVEILIPNTDILLKPGMFARIQIRFAKHENVTVVPAGSLIKRNGVQGIFLADPDKKSARFVPVKTGITNASMVEVLSPSVSGMVVTLGQHLLEDGSAIIWSDGYKNNEGTPKKILPGSKEDRSQKQGDGTKAKGTINQ